MSSEAAVWRAGDGRAEVRFVGRGGAATRAATLSRVEGAERPVAWLRQVHSALCVEAGDGASGEGDALWTSRPGVALCVATADCVPLVLAGGRGLAVVHAGWRGIVAGVVGRAAGALRLAAGAAEARAWIGPAIGSCCYEVGSDVAARVAAVSAPPVVVAGAGERPHLDLVAAVTVQLRRAGVSAIESLGPCTRCTPAKLHSYRRDGAGAGRNLAFAWLR